MWLDELDWSLGPFPMELGKYQLKEGMMQMVFEMFFYGRLLQ